MRPGLAPCLVGLVSLGACTLLADLDGFDASDASDAGGRDAQVEHDGGDAGVADPYRREVLADRPIAYYPFEEGPSAVEVKDLVGGRALAVRPGVLSGLSAPDGPAGRVIGCGDGGVLVGGDQLDVVGERPFTLELWTKPSLGGGTFHNLVNKRYDGNGYVTYLRQGDDGQLDCQLDVAFDGGIRFAATEVPRGKWLHIVFTYEPVGGVVLYIDGAFASDGYVEPGGPYDPSTDLVLCENYSGLIDELAFYDHALSAGRVAAHYAARATDAQ